MTTKKIVFGQIKVTMKNLTHYLNTPGYYYLDDKDHNIQCVILVAPGGQVYFLNDKLGGIRAVKFPNDWKVRPMQDVRISGDIVAIETVEVKLQVL